MKRYDHETYNEMYDETNYSRMAEYKHGEYVEYKEFVGVIQNRIDKISKEINSLSRSEDSIDVRYRARLCSIVNELEKVKKEIEE